MRIDHVTTVMEISAVLFFVAAAAVAVAAFSVPGALAVVGLGLLAGSWVLTAAAGRGRSRR